MALGIAPLLGLGCTPDPTSAGQALGEESDQAGVEVEAGGGHMRRGEGRIRPDRVPDPGRVCPHGVVGPVPGNRPGTERRGRDLVHQKGEMAGHGWCPGTEVFERRRHGPAALVPQHQHEGNAQLLHPVLDGCEDRLVEHLPGGPYAEQVPDPLVEDQLGRDTGVDAADDDRERVLPGGEDMPPGALLVGMTGLPGGVPPVAREKFVERRAGGRRPGAGAATAGVDAVVVSTEAVVAARKALRFGGMTLPQELCL